MTLHLRLLYAGTAIFVLTLGSSVAVWFVRDAQARSIDVVMRAYERERALAEVSRCVLDHHRQVTLLTQTFGSPSATDAPSASPAVGVDRAIRERFRAGSAACRAAARASAEGVEDHAASPALTALAEQVDRLVTDWDFVVDNLGTDHVAAVTRQASSADPTADDVLSRGLPEAQRAMDESLSRARTDFERAALRADMGIAVVLLAAFITVASVSLLVLRRVMVGLAALRDGMQRYGNGRFDHRVHIDGADELTAMAAQINAMAERLADNRVELERRAQDLQRTVDELRSTQAMIVQQEKMAALGGLVAGVAHEVNTPLGVAVTTGSLIQDHVNELRAHVDNGTATRGIVRRVTENVEQALSLLTSNLARAASLIQSFKEVAVDRGHVTTREVQLGPWLNAVLQSLSPVLRRSGVVAEQQVHATEPVLLAAGELEQVITNLVVNACTHAFNGSAEGVRAAGHVRVTLLQTHDTVTIEVADDGVGMPPEVAARVFEPFFTTRRGRGGTGLGMHITHQIVVERFSGTISLDTRPGEGTRWRMNLPMPTEALLPAGSAALSPPPGSRP